MKVAVIICCVLSLGLAAGAQNLQQQCGSHPNLLRDNSGELKWLTADEMQIRATKVVAADPVAMPNGAAYSGVVGAKVMVSTSGNVVCLWGVSGNPVTIQTAVSALREWKFKPMTVGGKLVEYVGQVKVPVRSTKE